MTGSLRADDNLTLISSVLRSGAEILVLDPQPTQRITGSAFRISLQPDWLLPVLRQTKQRSFLTGQSWCVLKSGYTAGSPEQGFRRCFADGVNQSLISSARRLHDWPWSKSYFEPFGLPKFVIYYVLVAKGTIYWFSLSCH